MRLEKPIDGVFLVTRSSVMLDGCPCEEAFKVEVRNDPKIFNNTDWSTRWAVKIDNVLDFVKKYGRCVVQINNQGFPEIEIYDFWRE